MPSWINARSYRSFWSMPRSSTVSKGGARGPPPNRVSEEVEAAILARALEHPTHGVLRVPQELVAQGVRASSGRVRGV